MSKTTTCPHCGNVFEVAVTEAGAANDSAIELYYRSRAAGSRMTLQKIAERTGLKYESLKTHKRRYDAAGKYGSKKKANA